MKDDIQKAIKILTKLINDKVDATDALKYTQAALNLAHVQSILTSTKDGLQMDREAYIDYNFRCPECDWVMVRETREHPHTLECSNPHCKDNNILYAQPTLVLRRVRPVVYREGTQMYEKTKIEHSYNLSGMSAGDWFLGCNVCWFQLPVGAAGANQCPNCVMTPLYINDVTPEDVEEPVLKIAPCAPDEYLEPIYYIPVVNPLEDWGKAVRAKEARGDGVLKLQIPKKILKTEVYPYQHLNTKL